MDEIFTIEEGIAIPPKATGRKSGLGKWEKLVASLNLTTENLLSGAKSKKQAAAIRRAFNERGFNIVTRREGDGIRIWKIAKAAE